MNAENTDYGLWKSVFICVLLNHGNAGRLAAAVSHLVDANRHGQYDDIVLAGVD